MPSAWTETNGGFLRTGPSQFCVTKGPMIQQYHKRSLDKCQSLAHCSSWSGTRGCQDPYPIALTHTPLPRQPSPYLQLLLKQRKCRHLLEGLPSTLSLSVTGKKAWTRVRKYNAIGIIILQAETGKAGRYPEASPRGLAGDGFYAENHRGNSRCLVYSSRR